MGQEEQFASGFRGGENALGFGDLAELAMIAFHRVGGIDQATDLGGIREAGCQILPVILPGANRHRIFAIPFFSEFLEVGFGALAGGGRVNFLQLGQEGLAIVPGDIFQAIADLMDDAALDLRLREDGQHGLLETAQPIQAGNENIFDLCWLLWSSARIDELKQIEGVTSIGYHAILPLSQTHQEQHD